MLISIVFEAMPFVLLGTVISSVIEEYVSSKWIAERMANRGMKFYMVAGIIGLFIPVCECAIVPVMRRLVKKGVPAGIAVTFMLAVPIVNPIVLLSTYYAFSGKLMFVILRGGLGFIGAVAIGLIMDKLVKNKVILKEGTDKQSCSCNHVEHDHVHESSCSCNHHEDHGGLEKKQKRWLRILGHINAEFIEVSKYLIMGAIIAAAMQSFISKQSFSVVSTSLLLSIVMMMLMAFVLSLCSEADAFIAATFQNIFPTGAIIAFLIFGPMMDIKNMLMLSSSFKIGFVVRLIGLIFGICLILSLLVSLVL